MSGSVPRWVARPLRQVHDLRDVMPVREGDAALPGPKYVGPQAERYRVRDEESLDASLDYCSGCGICTQVCPQGVHIAEINSQARAGCGRRDGITLRDRLIARPDVIGRLGTPVAPLANWTLGQRRLRTVEEGRWASIAAPRCRASPAGRSTAGHAATAPPARAQRRLLPRLRRRLLRAPARGDGRRGPRAQRAARRRAEAGLLRPAPAVERQLPSRRGTTSGGSRRASRRTPARGSTSSRTRRAAA